MTPAYLAIVLIKTLWLHGISSDVEPRKWVRPPVAYVTVQTETSLDQCEKDGRKWLIKADKAAKSKRMDKVPLDEMNYRCITVQAGGYEA